MREKHKVLIEELVSGEHIEIEHFIVIDVQTIERASNRQLPERRFRKITVRTSKAVERLIFSLW